MQPRLLADARHPSVARARDLAHLHVVYLGLVTHLFATPQLLGLWLPANLNRALGLRPHAPHSTLTCWRPHFEPRAGRILDILYGYFGGDLTLDIFTGYGVSVRTPGILSGSSVDDLIADLVHEAGTAA